MLSSNTEGEAIAAVNAILRVLATAGLDIHTLVSRVEHGKAGDGKTDEELQKALDEAVEKGIQIGLAKGIEQGRRSAVIAAAPSMIALGDVGTGVNGYSWLEIAEHAERNLHRLNDWEKGFIENVTRKLRYKPPSINEAAKLHQIFHQRFGEKI